MYIDIVDYSISRKLKKKLDINTVSTNRTNLGTLLGNNKEKLYKKDKSCIYEFSNALYIGQIGRNIETR